MEEEMYIRLSNQESEVEIRNDSIFSGDAGSSGLRKFSDDPEFSSESESWPLTVYVPLKESENLTFIPVTWDPFITTPYPVITPYIPVIWDPFITTPYPVITPYPAPYNPDPRPQRPDVHRQPSVNLSANGFSQIVAWDAAAGAVGYIAVDGSDQPEWKGLWEWADPSVWSVEGTGRFDMEEFESVDGILLYNHETCTFAAWTNIYRGDYGYVSLGTMDSSFHVVCIDDFFCSNHHHILVANDAGSFGIMRLTDAGLTYCDVWHVEDGAGSEWVVKGGGYFGHESYSVYPRAPNGKLVEEAAELIVFNTSDSKYYRWRNNDCSFSTWDWDSFEIGSVEDSCEFMGVGDLLKDGFDDMIFHDTETGRVFAWNDGDASSVRELGILSSDYVIEGTGEYDGKDGADLLLRKAETGELFCWGGGSSDEFIALNATVDPGFAILH